MKVVETARVISVEGRRARVAVQEPTDPALCSGCAMAGRCGIKARRFTVRAPVRLSPGDQVRVEIDLPSPAWAAFLVLMVPLAAAFGAGGAVYALARSEVWALACGVLGAAAAYLALHLTGAGSGGSAALVEGTRGEAVDPGGDYEARER